MRKAFLALAAAVVVAAPVSADAWAEKMFKDGLKHDFGTVPRGALLVHRFPITNIYAVRMEITNVTSGCGCVTATPTKRVLEPRESTTIEVRMDGKRFVGPKTVSVRVTVGPEFISSAELKVTANGRADVVFNPGQVDFATVARGQTPVKHVDVEYAGKVDWKVGEILAKDVPFTATIQEVYRRPAAGGNHQVGYRLFVALKADAGPGVHKHNLYLKTNDPNGPMVPILVEASVQSLVQVTPSQLDLGVVKTDAALIRRVVVRGTRPFRILGVDGTGNGVELGAPLSDREAVTHFVTFKCQVTTPGPFREEIKIRTSLQTTPVNVVIEGTASR
jgi:hypothetical protein